MSSHRVYYPQGRLPDVLKRPTRFNTSPLLGIGAPLLRVLLELLPRDPRLVALVAELLRLAVGERGTTASSSLGRPEARP